MHHLRQPSALWRGELHSGLSGGVGGWKTPTTRGGQSTASRIFSGFLFFLLPEPGDVVKSSEQDATHSNIYCFTITNKASFPFQVLLLYTVAVFLSFTQGEEGRGKKSVLDADPEVQAMMEMTGKTLHSQGLREPEEDQEQ